MNTLKQTRKRGGGEIYTPGSMNSLFGDFVQGILEGILGGVRDYLGVD